MKTKTKALVLALCAVLLVVTTVFATMAYLTSTTGVVKNTFTSGKVAITLDEADVNEYGVAIDGAARVTANEYKLIPGHEYTKDPTITVSAGSEDCWVFAKVENGLDDIADLDISADWTEVAANVYAYKETLSAGETATVFTKFTVAGDADVVTYENAEITIIGYAVQADGFDTAATAWAAAPTTWTTGN